MRKLKGVPGVYYDNRLKNPRYFARMLRGNKVTFSKTFIEPGDAETAFRCMTLKNPPCRAGRKPLAR